MDGGQSQSTSAGPSSSSNHQPQPSTRFVWEEPGSDTSSSLSRSSSSNSDAQLVAELTTLSFNSPNDGDDEKSQESLDRASSLRARRRVRREHFQENPRRRIRIIKRNAKSKLREISPLRISQPRVRPPSAARCVTALGAPRVVRDSEIWSEDSDIEALRRPTAPRILETIVEEEQTPRDADSSSVRDLGQPQTVTGGEGAQLISSSSDSELVSDDSETSDPDSPTGFVIGPHIPIGNLAVHFNGESHKHWAHALRYKHDLNRQLYLPEIWVKDMCLGLKAFMGSMYDMASRMVRGRTSPPSKPKPKVLVLGLTDRAFVDSCMYRPMRRLLEKHADFRYAWAQEELGTLFEKFEPTSILVVDAGLVFNDEVRYYCALFARKGGRLVFACNFASGMPPGTNTRRFFQNFGVYWEFSREHRDLAITGNENFATNDRSWTLPELDIVYERTQVLSNVKTEHAPYVLRGRPSPASEISEVPSIQDLPIDDIETIDGQDPFDAIDRALASDAEALRQKLGEVQVDITEAHSSSSSDAAKTAVDPTEQAKPHRFWSERVETPVAWAKYSKGWVGAICDHTMQWESKALILVMLGLMEVPEAEEAAEAADAPEVVDEDGVFGFEAPDV